jgi:hypothetical protein
MRSVSAERNHLLLKNHRRAAAIFCAQSNTHEAMIGLSLFFRGFFMMYAPGVAASRGVFRGPLESGNSG